MAWPLTAASKYEITSRCLFSRLFCWVEITHGIPVGLVVLQGTVQWKTFLNATQVRLFSFRQPVRDSKQQLDLQSLGERVYLTLGVIYIPSSLQGGTDKNQN